MMKTVFAALVLAVAVGGAHPSLRAATLEVTILDEGEHRLPARVLVKTEQGECLVPPQATTLRTGADLWFVSDGRSQLEVPAGRVLLRVEHGLEYIRFKQWFEMPETGVKKTIPLRRWVDMRQQGYLCGENHLHVDSKTLAPMLAAEGLDFGTSLTWWRGPDARRPIPPGEGRIRTLSFAGRDFPTSIYDAELEYAWGAAYLLNLPAPMPLKAEPGRPNLDYVKHAADAGAIVHYQGGWSREVLLDALLGYVHTVNICNNNFALHRFQPRSRYSNLLEVDGFPIYPDTAEGMLRMNTDTYYRLLNCGLRLAAGAGSATGVKQAPVGYNRAYVRVDAEATIDEFYAAWKRGENFVTNGPMLWLRTDAGQRPGDTVALPEGGGMLHVRLSVSSAQPLRSVEIIRNGVVTATIDADDPRYVAATLPLRENEGAWIAARCTAYDDLLSDEELTAYENAGRAGRLPVAPSRLRFAHTSPIYVTVGGNRPAVRESIEEARRMLDAFERFATETTDAAYRAAILSAIEDAQRKLLGSALGSSLPQRRD